MPLAPSTNLYVFPGGPVQTNGYLLTVPEEGSALLIDAPGGIWEEVAPVLDNDRCRLRELWLTHGHWDHTMGGAELVRKTGAIVRAHPADRRLIEDPRAMSEYAQGLNLEPVKVDHAIEPGQPLVLGGLKAEVRAVPGHCPGSVLFYFAPAGAAFVGDALFRRGVGRTDLPGGDAALLARSIREQIYRLPGDTAVYPGHGPETTVGEERASNPFVRG